MQRFQISVISWIIALAIVFSLGTSQAQTAPYYTTKTPTQFEAQQAPEINLLVCYRIKSGFGSKIIIDAVALKTRALTGVDAYPDQLLNDLIAELGKRGLLANVKGLDRPARASITILSWEPIPPNFIYTTEQQLQTPNLPE